MELQSLKLELPAKGQIILVQRHFIKTYVHMYNFVPTVDRDHYVD
jgi:adenosine/AMP kinase